MRYFLAFVLCVTFIARQKLLRMLSEEKAANKDLVDSILAIKRPKINLRRKRNKKE